jgi:hypothetical protein
MSANSCLDLASGLRLRFNGGTRAFDHEQLGGFLETDALFNDRPCCFSGHPAGYQTLRSRPSSFRLDALAGKIGMP